MHDHDYYQFLGSASRIGTALAMQLTISKHSFGDWPSGGEMNNTSDVKTHQVITNSVVDLSCRKRCFEPLEKSRVVDISSKLCKKILRSHGRWPRRVIRSDQEFETHTRSYSWRLVLASTFRRSRWKELNSRGVSLPWVCDGTFIDRLHWLAWIGGDSAVGKQSSADFTWSMAIDRKSVDRNCIKVLQRS